MSDKKEIVDYIVTEKLISIVRLQNQASVQPTVDALITGGISVLEITVNTPGFSEEIERARKRHPHVLIGAGTVTNADLAKRALASGAQFLVTPNTRNEVAETALAHDIPLLMGAMTPTEVANAIGYGADIIKLFPAGALGISYFTSLKGPFDRVPFFAVGGVDESNLGEWLAAGIDGVGLGSSLVKNNVRLEVDYKKITTRAKKFIKMRDQS
ncbi:MAG TPA: bifunctional 4-hydroxy-2-oxoglutarate aldolase/2-dehydro-3-deoxy-phosphogluconate aldolase [Pricia sp.]|nr:bifunctional 4-hydroxy-2-oxoglutarate aldolase/2-dehydro-3-deoxy-phosphogluconate aldolase [Pricia sp.]